MEHSEKIHGWWSRLSDQARDALMDDPEQTLPEWLSAAVTEAGAVVWGADFTDGGPVQGPHLTPDAAEFVRDQAAQREAGLAP